MSKRNKAFWRSDRANKMSLNYWRENLINIALSMFEWRGLPDSIDERFIEWNLCMNGFCLYFNDDVLGNLAMGGTLEGPVNNYQLPTKMTAIGVGGYYRNLGRNDCVIIYNDMLHNNTIHGIDYLASRMWDKDRTIDVNTYHQKTPKLIRCNENQLLSLMNMYEKVDGNQPYIFGSRTLDLQDISVFDTTAPFVADRVLDVQDRIWNMAMQYLGIPNSPVNKRERVNTLEVNYGNGATVGMRYSRLFTRQQAAEQINQMFGTNVSVDYRNFSAQTMMQDMQIDRGGDQSE